MAERTAFYSTLVPYSCIPSGFLEPLTLEDAGEYTIDESRFPGITLEDHIRQPALVLAKPNSLPAPAEHSPCGKYQLPMPHHQQTAAVLQESTQYYHQYHNTSPSNTSAALHPVPNSRRIQQSNCASNGKDLDSARADLLTIISGLQNNEFAKSSNPFDAMPALLSAVSFDYVSSSSHAQAACQARVRGPRLVSVKRRVPCYMTQLQKPLSRSPPSIQPATHTDNVENVSLMLQRGQSRKRSFQVDDLDDILQCESMGNKRTKFHESSNISTQCWSYGKGHMQAFNAVMSFGGNIGIVGY